MIQSSDLLEISLYTITKENEFFNEPLDTTRLDDNIIIDYAVNTVNKTYNNKRTLEFNYHSDEVNGNTDLDPDHVIVSKIKDILNDLSCNNTFKVKTKSIANTLFGHTPPNARKGDLLTCLFKLTDKYYLVLLKIDENKILKRGEDNLWVMSSGLDILTKLQKAVYIEIPRVNSGYEEDYLLWDVKAIDNISNDSYYWNINFLNAHYKNDSKINSERFGNFIKDFVNTIEDPLRKNDVTFLYRNFLRSNDTFAIEEFISSVFGTSSEYIEERTRFRESLIDISSNPDLGFDLVFDFHQATIRKEYGAKGSFVFDNEIKVTPTAGGGDEAIDEDILKDKICFGKNEELGYLHDTNGRYVKVYYENYSYQYK